MTTQPKNEHNELFSVVRNMLRVTSTMVVENAINRAHRGRVEWPITNDTLHLFRRYRNTVSADARRLIDDSRAHGAEF